MIVIHPSYFSPISQFAVLAQHKSVCLEVCDNYQKQTYRNRCYIYGANGKLRLNIPIIHSRSKKRQLTNEVQIENASNWKKQHLKSIQTAYQSSPYFEFYEDDFKDFYTKEYTNLMTLNKATMALIINLLDMNISLSETQEYQIKLDQKEDYRDLIDAKVKHPFEFANYTQIFEGKYGFLPNLSILDLLFMEGPNALNYLENQDLERL